MKADWRLSIVVEVMTQTVQMALTVIVHYWADWVRRGSNSYRMLARPAESVDSCQSGERGRGGVRNRGNGNLLQSPFCIFNLL